MKKSKEPKRIRLNFFKRFKLSIFNIEQYHIIAQESILRSIKYLVILFLIFSIISTITTVLKADEVLDKVSNELYSLPYFKIENSEFLIESNERKEIENSELINIKFIFDGNDTSDSYIKNEIKYDGMLVIFAKDKIVVQMDNQRNAEFEYTTITKQTENKIVDKDMILELIKDRKNINSAMSMYVFIFIFTLYFIAALFDALCLALLGYIVSRLIKLPLKFFAVFSMAVSSMTLPIILNLIYIVARILTGFEMQKFQLMYSIVSYIYIIAAILILRSNLIRTSFKIEEKIKNEIKNDEDANTEKSN